VIILSLQEWRIVQDSIIAEHGRSMVLLRDKMRRELGFTAREHTYKEDKFGIYYNVIREIHLDFYSDAAETMFRLKWL